MFSSYPDIDRYLAKSDFETIPVFYVYKVVNGKAILKYQIVSNFCDCCIFESDSRVQF